MSSNLRYRPWQKHSILRNQNVAYKWECTLGLNNSEGKRDLDEILQPYKRYGKTHRNHPSISQWSNSWPLRMAATVIFSRNSFISNLVPFHMLGGELKLLNSMMGMLTFNIGSWGGKPEGNFKLIKLTTHRQRSRKHLKSEILLVILRTIYRKNVKPKVIWKILK